jgi:hypothetical protein
MQLPEGSALDPDMKIKKNYVRKTAGSDQPGASETSSKAAAQQGQQKCPNCKQNIPKSEWREHFKICTMDSQWKEQKQQRMERESNAPGTGDEITQNLRRFAAQRPDIFGSQEQAAAQSSKPAEPQSQSQTGPSPVIWDGQSTSITRTTANIAMLRNQQQKNLTETLMTRGELDPKSLVYLKQQ